MPEPSTRKSRKRHREGFNNIHEANYSEISGIITTYVRDFWQEKGYSPSTDEIAATLGYHRTTAYYWVHRMRAKGDLLFESGVSRSIRLPGQTVNFCDGNKVS